MVGGHICAMQSLLKIICNRDFYDIAYNMGGAKLRLGQKNCNILCDKNKFQTGILWLERKIKYNFQIVYMKQRMNKLVVMI